MIPLSGLIPFTAIDYPGKLSGVIFTQGCPWRCGYCHNPHLQPFGSQGALLWGDVMRFFESRKGLLDAVVFSGGEASLHKGLAPAMRALKDLGYLIGLHTAGISPSKLELILSLVDWVGMDIKAPFAKYEAITKKRSSGEDAQNCAKLILASGVSYEFRTTVHRNLLSEEDIRTIVKSLKALGATSFALQEFRAQGCASKNLCLPGPHISKALADEIAPHFNSFIVRSA